jgi:hypothetical protein
LRGSILSFIHVSEGKLHDVDVLDLLLPEAGAFYVLDRGYLDLERLYLLDQADAFFMIRAKRDISADDCIGHPSIAASVCSATRQSR